MCSIPLSLVVACWATWVVLSGRCIGLVVHHHAWTMLGAWSCSLMVLYLPMTSSSMWLLFLTRHILEKRPLLHSTNIHEPGQSGNKARWPPDDEACPLSCLVLVVCSNRKFLPKYYGLSSFWLPSLGLIGNPPRHSFIIGTDGFKTIQRHRWFLCTMCQLHAYSTTSSRCRQECSIQMAKFFRRQLC
jgi:hypothetical protein